MYWLGSRDFLKLQDMNVGLVLLDTDRRYVFANATYCELFGLDPSLELSGQRMQQVTARLYELLLPALERALRGESLSHEIRISSQSGHGARCYAVDLEARLQAEPPHVMLAIVETTGRETAESGLLESEARFRKLAENMREVFWLADALTAQLLYVSPAFESIWARPCERLYEEPALWAESVHPEDREPVERARAAHANADYEVQYRIVRPDLGVRWILERIFQIRDAKGFIHRRAGIAEDVTRIKELEQQYRHAQKMEAIGRIAGGVAHDFNNVLASIQMQTALMKMDEPLSPTHSEIIREISVAAERASTLTRQLLLFSRRQTMQSCDLNLNDTVGNLIQMLRRVLGEDVHVDSKLCAEPLTVHADAGMVDQVLMNLAVNSRDAMPSGGRLGITTSKVDFAIAPRSRSSRARAGAFVCLSVSDTGTGIPPEVLPHIFKPFFTTKEDSSGTGLGLSAIQGIVEQHEGWIEVQSEMGKGTTFHVYLPRVVRPASRPDRPAGVSYVSGGSETILLVEDDSSVRKLACHLLEDFGYRVLEAPNGVEAEAIWKEHREEIRLLLTDMVMPGGLTGRQLAMHLLEQDPGLKVVYSSGYNPEMAGTQLVLEKGFHFVPKPYQAGHLLETVRACLDGNAGS